MIRIDSPHGRTYKAPVGILPSVTTVLKHTNPRPFNPEQWISKIMRKGLSEVEGEIYAENWIDQGMSREDAMVIARSYINRPMNRQEAVAYTNWKTPHSSERGSRLHHFLEHHLPVDVDLDWSERPISGDSSTDRLVQSLWKAGILQGIKRVVSLEQELWWYKDGVGYAGSEDIAYIDQNDLLVNGDWKSKDPKDYSHTKYSHEYKLQLIAYAAARKQRTGVLVNGCNINYCLSDASPGEQLFVSRQEAYDLWEEWIFRVKAWWSTIGQNLTEQRNA